MPDLVGFTAGLRPLVKPTRLGHARVPAPAAADRAPPVRHDLPRALPVLLAAHRVAGPGHRRARPWSTSRSCPRTAARCGCTPGPPRSRASRAGRVGGARRRSGGGPAHRRGPRRVRRARSPRVKRDLRRVPARARAGRARRWSATAPRARATRCSTTAASGRTCSPTPSTAARTSRACSCPGTHIPIHAARAHRRGPARLRAGAAVEPARPRSPAQLAYVRDWGGRLVFPIPAAGGGGRAVKVVLFCGGSACGCARAPTTSPKPMATDRRPAAALARHALLRPLRPHRLHPLPRATARTQSRTTSCTTTRRCPTTSPCRGGARSSCSAPTSPTGTITFIDTGLNAPIGERLMRVREYVEDEEMFLANYADTLTDAPLDEMIDAFQASDAAGSHARRAAGVDASTSSRSPTTAGSAASARSRELTQWENGGYFVLRPEIFDVLPENGDHIGDACTPLAEQGRCSPSATTASGARPTRSRTGPSWRRSTARDAPWMLWDGPPAATPCRPSSPRSTVKGQPPSELRGVTTRKVDAKLRTYSPRQARWSRPRRLHEGRRRQSAAQAGTSSTRPFPASRTSWCPS